MSANEIHGAIQGDIPDGLLTKWIVVCEVLDPDGSSRFVAIRGAGLDGEDQVRAWEAIGLLEAGALMAKDAFLATDEVEDE